MSILHDSAGHAVSGANADSLAAYEQAAHELRCLIGDPVATIDRAIAAGPVMPMAHVLKAWLFLLGTEPAGIEVAKACADAVAECTATEREQRHLEAVRRLTAGRWRAAALALEDLSATYPRDALALQAGHQLDFFTGDARMLRDRIARALPHWSADQPGYHAVLGMHAFGLEETGHYDASETAGRRAVELQPRDSWAWHAVAHVQEMRNRPEAGIAWLEPNAATWSRESFLGVHNWWHLALFHLERDDIARVLELYDASIGGPGSTVVLDMLDQSALLWRLQLRGAAVGAARWEALADRWTPFVTAGNYAFNDLHAMMAFVGAGREREQRALLDTQREVLRTGEDGGDNAAFMREVGHAATLAVQAFSLGDYAEAASRLRPIRSVAHRFGGSHAQRDVLDLTLIEAAIRGGDRALASALAAERRAMRPASEPTARFVERSMALSGTTPASLGRAT